MKDKLEILLKKINQNQLLKKIQKLPSLQRENLESALEQIDSFDLNLLALDKKKIQRFFFLVIKKNLILMMIISLIYEGKRHY